MITSTAKAEAIAKRDVGGLTVALREQLFKNYINIPKELKDRNGWLLFKVTQIADNGKFNKIPIYPASGAQRNGTQGSPEDMANLCSWDEAWSAFKSKTKFAGLGFACLTDFNIVALDADHCVSDDGVRQDVIPLVEDTYCEFSPSGTGLRAFYLGKSKDGKNHDKGFELFHANGFVTVTGDWYVDGSASVLTDEMRQRLETLSTARGGTASKLNSSDKLREAADADPRLRAIKNAGLYERDLGNGKHSICCPVEHMHSDTGRNAGDGDTVYYQPHTNGYDEGWIHCLHTHPNDQFEYWARIGYNPIAEAVNKLLAGYDNPNGEGWPTPEPIPDDLPPVPTFDLALLPESIRPWIQDISERMQIAPDIPAMGAVVALSAAIGRRFQIMPKANDDWTVIPNLWGAVVAPPGYMKSPALAEVMRPLHRLEQEAYASYKSDIAIWQSQKHRVDIANKAAMSNDQKKLKSDPTAAISDLLDDPEEPVAKRYCVNNFSMEALGEVLRDNPHGVMAFSDEIHGLLAMAQKPGNEGLNDFLLTAWNGDGAFTFDRIGRGLNRRVDHVCVAVLGGIQPGRLVEHVVGATHGGAGDTGLMQRFQLLTWPDLRQEWSLVDRKPNKEAQEQTYLLFKRLTRNDLQSIGLAIAQIHSLEEPDVRRFDKDAQSVFYKWLEELERQVRGDTLPTVMASHLSKYRSLVPSLALIFAVSDDVSGPIPVRYVEQAIGWVNYLRPHAERTYACTVRPDTRHAQALLKKIKVNVLTSPFKPSDVYLKGWSQLDREGVNKATEMLCDLHYLVRSEVKNPAGGRPSVTFHINPKSKI